jgi:hypothetical protein
MYVAEEKGRIREKRLVSTSSGFKKISICESICHHSFIIITQHFISIVLIVLPSSCQSPLKQIKRA